MQLTYTYMNIQSHNQDNSSKRNLKALKNLSMLMSSFIVCWGQFTTHKVFCIRNLAFCLEHQVIKMISISAVAMFLANNMVSPIVYAVRFRCFNAAFRLMLGVSKKMSLKLLWKLPSRFNHMISVSNDKKGTIWSRYNSLTNWSMKVVVWIFKCGPRTHATD